MAKDSIEATFTEVVFSPKGHVEGFMAEVDGGRAQFVLGRDDQKSADIVAALSRGQRIKVNGKPAAASPKGPSEHPVYELARIVAVDGVAPKVKPAQTGYAGTIARINFARHGAANGYVLDTGDFIHVRPEGFASMKLQVGDRIRAEGDAHWLATGDGWAVEATSVNGKRLR